MQIYQLCDVLNVPQVAPMKRRGTYKRGRATGMHSMRRGFWERNAASLDYILKDLHGAYRKRISRVHGDKPGGSHEAAVAVNAAWTKIKRLFAQRGVVLVVLLLTGCVRFQVIQTDESPDERVITTKISGVAWFSSAQSISQIKALQTDKTQSFGVGTLGQHGATNTVAALEALARIAEAVRPTP
jgi:hypothetical protein